eukprot:jgi/Ulvmu1/11378/UM075_0040.1
MAAHGMSIMTNSSCELLVLVPQRAPSTQEYLLAISSASRNWDAVLVKINPKTGALIFDNEPGVDVFSCMEDARKFLQSHGRVNVKATGKVVLGCVVVACNLWILLATDLNNRPAVQLPGNHCVYNITAVQWECIPLQIRTGDPEGDYRLGEMLTEFPIAGYHYFCETVDVTRPFPSAAPASVPCWEYVWNCYLTQPLRRVGLPNVAPHMLQGLAERRSLPDFTGKLFDVVLFARRSRLHAGTRYKARGLNALSAPANEIECEQIILMDGTQWSSYVWRRGSVPLRWSQTVKPNGVGTAIAVESQRTFEGSRRYFRRLQLRYQHLVLPQAEVKTKVAAPADAAPGGSPVCPVGLTPSQRAASRKFPIAVVNLLRKGSLDRDRSEAKLYSAFCDLMHALQHECGMDIVNIGLDWHELASTHGGLAPVVQILWGATEQYAKRFGFTKGEFVEARAADAAADETLWGPGLVARRERRQAGVFRFNCADSLDRTNVASYYSAFQVLLEQARAMGLQLVGYRCEGMLPGPGGVPMREMGVGGGAGRGVQKATKLLGTFASRMGSMAQGMMASNSGTNLAGMSKRGTGSSSGMASPGGGANGGASDTAPDSGSEAAAAVPAPMPAPTHIQAADGTWWERKSVPWPQGAPTGKRDVFVNHDSRTVQWDPPPAWSAWQVLKQPVDTIRALAQPQLLAVYKELFRVSGDKNAELYTGSAAMHSSQLDLLLTEGVGAQGVTGFLNNAHTAVTRRFKNIVTDERTHSIFELILGTAGGYGESEVNPSTSTAASLSAEARVLPIADDEDSGSDEDCLADRPWPSRSAAAAAATSSPHGTGSPVAPRALALRPAAGRAAPPSPPRLQPDLTSPPGSADMPPVEQLAVEEPQREASPADDHPSRGKAAGDVPAARPVLWVSEPGISTTRTASPRRPARAASGFQSPAGRSRKGSMSDIGMPTAATGGASSIDVAGLDLLRFDDEVGGAGAGTTAAPLVAAPDPFAVAADQAAGGGVVGPGTVFDGGAAPGGSAGNPFAPPGMVPGMGPGATHSSAGRLSSFVEIPAVGAGSSDPFALPADGPVVQTQGGTAGDPLM